MKEDYLSPVEKPIEFWINGELVNIFLCSPYDLKDFALGYLFTSGIIEDRKDIELLSINNDYNKICVDLKKGHRGTILNKAKFIISQYNYKDSFYDSIKSISKVESSKKFPLEYIKKYAHIMLDESIINKETGGVHIALISDLRKNYFIREDIGRHTAMDKALGAYLDSLCPLSDTFACLTGRLSADMVLKAAILNIPILVSLNQPSQLAIEIGDYYNISLVSHILDDEAIIYTHKNRILL